MRVPGEHFTDRAGVLAVQLIFTDELHWLCREQPTSDFGIDAHAEVVASGLATGRLLALQIKSGKSYFDQSNEKGVTYYGNSAHLQYWSNHSLPVVVILYDPESKKAYWEFVSLQSVQHTKKAWKLVVPWSHELVAGAAAELEERAQGDPLQLLMRRLEMDRTWMERVRDGDRLIVEVDEWVNKSSGRGDFRLVVEDRNGRGEVVRDWPYQVFPGAEYSELIPRLFPWAKVELHEPTYDNADEDRWQEEEGVWDSEDGIYIIVGDSHEEWLDRQPGGLRPYEEGDEVAKWRLQLRLGPLGEAFLTLHEFLEDSLGEDQ